MNRPGGATAVATAIGAARRAAAPWLLALAIAAGCGTTAARPGGAPAAVAGAPAFVLADRTAAVAIATVVMAPPARIAADLDALGQGLGIRLGEMALDELARAMADHGFTHGRDLLGAPAAPMALVIAKTPADPQAGFCLAVPLARPGDVVRLLAARPVSERNGAQEWRSFAGVKANASAPTYWTAVAGERTLLFADSYDDLAAIGPLAAAAAGKPLDVDVSASMDVEAWRRFDPQGFDAEVKEIFSDEKKRPAKGARRPKAMEKAMLRGMTASFRKAATETAVLRLAIDASPADGLIVRTEIVPRAGTALAATVAPAAGAAGYAVDPGLPIHDDRTAVIAWGSLGMLEGLLRFVLPAGSAGGAALDGFLQVFTGAGTCTLEVSEQPLTGICSFAIKPGVGARLALDRYAALTKVLIALEAGDEAGGAAKRRPMLWRRHDDVLEFERRLVTTDAEADPAQRERMRAFLGGDVAHYVVAVRGGRLLQIEGNTATARLAAWREPAARAPLPAALADALARTRGRDAVMVLDFLSLMVELVNRSTDPQARQAAAMMHAIGGLATARAPVVFAAGGPGKNGLAYELQIPRVTIDNLAALVRPYVGMMGAAAPKAAPPRPPR